MMNKAQKINREVADKLEQEAGGIEIHKMYWIAGSYESKDLQEVLEELTPSDWDDIFPSAKVPHIENFRQSENPGQIFIEQDMWGFFAVLHYPKHYDFHYNSTGEVTGCTTTRGIMTINYAYGETIPELLKAIEKVADYNLDYCKKQDKKYKKKAR
jgi:hypothetical protein